MVARILDSFYVYTDLFEFNHENCDQAINERKRVREF